MLYTQALDVAGEGVEPSVLVALLSNRWVKGHFRAARALQGLGAPASEVLAALRAALALEPGNREALQLRAAVERQAAAQAVGSAAAAAAGASSPGGGAVLQAAPEQQAALRAAWTPARLPQALRAGSSYILAPRGPAPAGMPAPENLLVLLHGLGDTPAPFARLAAQLALPATAALALAGPLAVPETQGGRAWHEAFDPATWELIQPVPGEARRLASLEATLDLLEAAVEGLGSEGGWPPRSLHLLGFSQGGAAALHLVRRLAARGLRLGSCVAVAGSLLEEDAAMAAATEAAPGGAAGVGSAGSGPAGTPVLITRGSADRVVSQQAADRTAAVLTAARCRTETFVVPGKGHAMVSGPVEAAALMQFWAKALRAAAPASGDGSQVVELATA